MLKVRKSNKTILLVQHSFNLGIYRVSGSFEQMDRLRKQFDFAPSSVDLSQVCFRCFRPDM